MRVLLSVMLLLLPTICQAKDIVITIPDDMYIRVVDAYHGEVGDELLKEIKTKLIEHETFIASVQASNDKKIEIENTSVGEVKDPDIFVEEKVAAMQADIGGGAVAVGSINWDDGL